MSFWGIVALVVTGAGTLASILGIFFAVYAKHNGKMTREFLAKILAEEQKSTREFLAKMDERMMEQSRMLEKMDERTAKISEQIERIPEKTATLLK